MNANVNPALQTESSAPVGVSQTHSSVGELINERDEIKQRLGLLEAENQELRDSLNLMKEKLRNYQPILRAFGNSLLTPEEAERIMREDKWVEFEEIMREVQRAGE